LNRSKQQSHKTGQLSVQRPVPMLSVICLAISSGQPQIQLLASAFKFPSRPIEVLALGHRSFGSQRHSSHIFQRPSTIEATFNVDPLAFFSAQRCF